MPNTDKPFDRKHQSHSAENEDGLSHYRRRKNRPEDSSADLSAERPIKRRKPDSDRDSSPQESSNSSKLDQIKRNLAEKKAALAAKLRNKVAASESSSDTQTLNPSQLHPSILALQEKSKNADQYQAKPGATTSSALPISQFATSKANQRVARDQERKSSYSANPLNSNEVSKESEKDKLKQNPYLQHLLTGKSRNAAPRKPKPLKFVSEGKYVKKAQKIRMEAKLQALKKKAEKVAERAGLDEELSKVGDEALMTGPVPDVEWWDAQFMLDGEMSYDNLDRNLDSILTPNNEDDALISNLVQHPVPIEPPFETSEIKANPLKLTKKEQKKARRLRRLQEQKDKQEKIRLGLLPPEPPKVKLSNMMRVVGQEAVLDPTSMEKSIRKQVQERLEKHLRDNEERKLTDEERSMKRIAKFNEDTSNGMKVCIYRIKGGDIGPSSRFKIKANALQNHLVGVGVEKENMSVIIVGGGPKGTRRFTRLMLERMKWNNDSAIPSKNDSIECAMIWTGQLSQLDFTTFKIFQCDSESSAREHLGPYSNYWDLAKHYKSS